MACGRRGLVRKRCYSRVRAGVRDEMGLGATASSVGLCEARGRESAGEDDEERWRGEDGPCPSRAQEDQTNRSQAADYYCRSPVFVRLYC